MSKSINRFLIEKGIKSNTQKITILQMVKWVDEWQEEVKNCSIPLVSQQRELLESFVDYAQGCSLQDINIDSDTIDYFLEDSNCG